MLQKENFNFAQAFRNLKYGEAMIVKETIMKRCKWLPQSFSQKKGGKRPLFKYSQHDVNEVQVVETTFRAFGINAWTGEPI